MMAAPRIVVVGSVNMDLVFTCERMPAPGETLAASSFRQVPGGKGANQAVAAAREGACVQLIGHVGDDATGEVLRRSLANDGIALEHLVSVAGTPSGVAGITVAADGQNSIVVAAGANACLSVGTVRALAGVIGDAQVLVCQLETPLAAVAEAIAIAREAGVTVVFNPAPVAPLAQLQGLLAQVDYLVVNETEAAELTGVEVNEAHSARRATRLLKAAGARAVLLTMGARGVCLDGGALLPAIPVRAVDTTAAGDTFVGSFAVAIAGGMGMGEAAGRARYAAALAVLRPGAQCSIPLRAEVDMFIERQPAEPGARHAGTDARR